MGLYSLDVKQVAHLRHSSTPGLAGEADRVFRWSRFLPEAVLAARRQPLLAGKFLLAPEHIFRSEASTFALSYSWESG